MTITPTSPRYVITHIGSDGLRRLTFAQQGQYTYSSRDEAYRMKRDCLATGLPRVLAADELATLEVRAVACHVGHHDPVGYYCDRFSVETGTILRDGVPFMGIASEPLRASEYGHSHVEVGALRHWLCSKLNALSSAELAEIVRDHKAR